MPLRVFVLVLVPLLVLVPVLVREYMLVTCTCGQVHVPVLAVVRVLVLALHRLLVLCSTTRRTSG